MLVLLYLIFNLLLACFVVAFCRRYQPVAVIRALAVRLWSRVRPGPLACVLCACMLFPALPSHAQVQPRPIYDLQGYRDPCAIPDSDAGNTVAADAPYGGVGRSGEPDACSYWHTSVGFTQSIAPIARVLLPTLLVILAIWRGPWLLKHLLNGFSRA